MYIYIYLYMWQWGWQSALRYPDDQCSQTSGPSRDSLYISARCWSRGLNKCSHGKCAKSTPQYSYTSPRWQFKHCSLLVCHASPVWMCNGNHVPTMQKIPSWCWWTQIFNLPIYQNVPAKPIHVSLARHCLSHIAGLPSYHKLISKAYTCFSSSALLATSKITPIQPFEGRKEVRQTHEEINTLSYDKISILFLCGPSLGSSFASL